MNVNPENLTNSGDYYKALDEFYVYAGDKKDKWIQNSIRSIGLWDEDLTRFLMQTVKPGWKCLDIGSHNGYFTELMARLSGPTGSVVAFEPMKNLVNLYEDGRKLNDYSNSAPITMYPFGLSDKSRNSYVRVIPHNTGGAYVTDDPNSEYPDSWGKCYTEPIELKRLDEIYNETPDIIKIDIENHEEFAFAGFGENTLKCPIIIAELGSGHSVRFLNYLNKNYNLYNIAGIKTETYNIIGEESVNIIMRKK